MVTPVFIASSGTHEDSRSAFGQSPADNGSQSVLRHRIVAPRIGTARSLVSPERQFEFGALIGRIWSEITRRLADPISVKLTPTRRSITVLGFSRYVIDNRTGLLTLLNLVPEGKPRRFRTAGFLFSADLPFRPSTGLFVELLREWKSEIEGFAADPTDDFNLFSAVLGEIRIACLTSSRWRVLRHGVRRALALDGDVLDLARRSRCNVQHREVDDMHYNDVVENLAALRRLRDDNPNLLWLFGLARSEGIRLNAGNGGLIEALRNRLLDEFKLPPAAWRFLANGHRRDFRIVLDWLGENASPRGRWLELREWLRLRVALGIEDTMPLGVQRIFLHDYYKVAADGASVTVRQTRLPIQTMRVIAREAMARHTEGTLCVFAENELADVLVWIRESGVCLDENQQKAGWPLLLRRAKEWKHDASLRAQRRDLRWESLVGPHSYAEWQVSPVTDVWQLHRASQQYRNCMDNYLADCMAGNVRMFIVETNTGRRVGAIGLVRRGRKWQLLDVRGFANVLPSAGLSSLGKALTSRYTMLWQALHPLLEQSATATVSVPTRAEGDFVVAECCNEAPELESPDDETGDDDDDAYSVDDQDLLRPCKVCGSDCLESGGDCGHLVASVDYFNGGLYFGALHERMDVVLGLLATYLRKLILARCSFSGLGSAFDKLIKSIQRDVGDSELPEDFLDEYSNSVQGALLGLVGNHPSVSEHYWEFDGGMPGCSTCGRDYWAPDPEAVVKDVIALLSNEAAAVQRKSA